MSTRINTPLDALVAQRQLNRTQTAFSKNVERLSSGLRIVHASDDAAGLAIAEKIHSEVRGLGQAVRNGLDGQSLLQTAEGALGEISNIIGRLKELAVQAANGTNTDSDRTNLQNEVKALLAEIDRTAAATDFNGRLLLNGGANTSAGSSNAAIVNNTVATADTASGSAVATTTAATRATRLASTALATTSTALGAASSLVVNGTSYAFQATDTVQAVLDTINANTVASGVAVTFNPGASFSFQQTTYGTGATTNITPGTGAFAAGSFAAETLGVNATVTGVGNAGEFSVVGRHVTYNSGAYKGLEFDVQATGAATVNVGPSNAIRLQVGAFKDQAFSIGIASVSVAGLGLTGLDVSTTTSANNGVGILDAANTAVTSSRAQIGAAQNRIGYTLAAIGVQKENLIAAESRIRDLDVAAETVEFTKNQILQSAGVSVLAQANQAPLAILALLK